MDFLTTFKSQFSLKSAVYLCSVVVMSSCSRLDVAFNYAPRYIANGLEESLDLSSERYKKIRATIEKDLQDNKVTLVNEAVGYLDSVEQLTASAETLSLTDAENNFAKLKELQKKAIGLFKPSFSEVILGISSAEVAHLKKHTAKRFEKADARLLDRDEFFKHNFKSFERTMDIMFGSVSAEQKKIYRTFVEENYEYYKNQIVARKHFMTQFEAKLSKKEEMLGYTMKYYSGDDSVKATEHLKLQKSFFDNLNKLQVDIWNSTTPKQKEEFRNTLVEIKAELRQLIK